MTEDVSTTSLQGSQGLQQFLLLAKTAKGQAAVELVKQVLSASGVYVFGELLETECVKDLAASESNSNYVTLLEIFAYGTYSDYNAKVKSLPPLTGPQTTKLKHLTIVTLAAKCRSIPYSTLLKELDIHTSNVRELEDLIIEAIYAGIIQAKLDQKNAQLEVECFIGRDIKRENLDSMIEKLEHWCSNCAAVLQAVEEEILRANNLKSDSLRDQERMEQESKQLRQTLMKMASSTSSTMDPEEDQFASQKQSGKKGIRGSALMQKAKVVKI